MRTCAFPTFFGCVVCFTARWAFRVCWTLGLFVTFVLHFPFLFQFWTAFIKVVCRLAICALSCFICVRAIRQQTLKNFKHSSFRCGWRCVHWDIMDRFLYFKVRVRVDSSSQELRNWSLGVVNSCHHVRTPAFCVSVYYSPLSPFVDVFVRR